MSRRSALGVRLFFLAAVSLPGAVVALELAAWLFGSPMLPFVERWTGPWCHYDPERTLSVGGALWPTCARCSGLYLGLMLGPWLGAILPREGRVLVRVVGVMLLPAGVGLSSAVAEAMGLIATGNTTRLFLGLMLTTGPLALGMVGARIVADALAGPANG